MIEATMVFLLSGNHMLLGQKTKSHCIGKLVPPGGKIDPGESVYRYAVRETEDECGLTPVMNRQPVGSIYCHYPPESQKDIPVHVFRAIRYKGDLRDSNELNDVQWYSATESTYDRMMAGDRFWVPHVMRNIPFQAELWYDADSKLTREAIVRTFAHHRAPRLK